MTLATQLSDLRQIYGKSISQETVNVYRVIYQYSRGKIFGNLQGGKAVRIVIKSNNRQTPRENKAGDSLEKLLSTYPKCTSSDWYGNDKYYTFSLDFTRFITFYIGYDQTN